jgi:tetratricopeptide (TPR) repeat protein
MVKYIYAFFLCQQIFKKYIEIELQLGNIDRCRKLYEKYLEWSPENCYAWSKYAELERSLAETERARAIFELAIAQPALDMPELLWKVHTVFFFFYCTIAKPQLIFFVYIFHTYLN